MNRGVGMKIEKKDPLKMCDNCGKCLEIKDDAVIKIDKIIMNEKE